MKAIQDGGKKKRIAMTKLSNETEFNDGNAAIQIEL